LNDVLGERTKMTLLMLMLKRHMWFHNLGEREDQVRKVLKILEDLEIFLTWRLIALVYLIGWICEVPKVKI
jgi:hypothetical protein